MEWVVRVVRDSRVGLTRVSFECSIAKESLRRCTDGGIVIDNFANKAGVPQGADGMINSVVDKYL